MYFIYRNEVNNSGEIDLKWSIIEDILRKFLSLCHLWLSTISIFVRLSPYMKMMKIVIVS